jgi:hypothetical protein
MQHLPGKRVLALIVGLATGAIGSAYAQDTSETGRATIDTTAPDTDVADTVGLGDTIEADSSVGADSSAVRDTTDTSGVQNPPGYRGMERDTTIFPDSAGQPASAEEVQNQTTGTYNDSSWQDTTGAAQNPAGYRGMERPAGDSTMMGHDSTMMGHDSTAVGDTEPRVEDSETPRLEPSDSPAGDTVGQAVDSTR